MLPIHLLFTRSILLFILCVIDLGFLIASYGVLRFLHISVNLVTWVAGSMLIASGVVVCLGTIFPHFLPLRVNAGANLSGAFALFVAVYAAGQWISRQWFLRAKKRVSKAVIQASKEVLVFLRKHHLFFGWIVVAGAVAHMVFYLPFLAHIGLYEEVTGFIAIGILTCMVLLGAWLWMETSLRKRRMSKAIHTLHSGLAIAFFIVLFLHV